MQHVIRQFTALAILLCLFSTVLYASISDHQKLQPAPLMFFGVQGGNQAAADSQGCWIGTLGCLVNKQGMLYILSNNHVFVDPGGNEIRHNVSTACKPDAYPVGYVQEAVPIDFNGINTVDAALAAITANVDPSGWIMGDSEADAFLVNTSPVLAEPGMPVKKSGRTTGLTQAKISAIGVTINVGYDGGVATFENQIAITSKNARNPFSAGGDSGSLIVTGNSCANPVGLLFAGSSNNRYTFANPIQDVISLLGFEFVGNPDPCTDTGGGGNDKPNNPGKGKPKSVLDRALEIRNLHAAKLHNVPGVAGTGVGIGDGSQPIAIEIYAEKITNRLRSQIPRHLSNMPVRIIETGKIIAY